MGGAGAVCVVSRWQVRLAQAEGHTARLQHGPSAAAEWDAPSFTTVVAPSSPVSGSHSAVWRERAMEEQVLMATVKAGS